MQIAIGTKVLLDAVLVIGESAVQTAESGMDLFTWTVSVTGAPSTIAITLWGSIDGTEYVALDTTAAAGMKHITGKLVKYVKAELVTLTGGTNPTVTVKVLAAAS